MIEPFSLISIEVLNSKRSHGADRVLVFPKFLGLKVCSTPNGVTERIGCSTS